MNHAIRLFRPNPSSVLFSSKPSFLGRKVSSVRVRQAQTLSEKPENTENMETDRKTDPDDPQEKNGDVMSRSYGEAYATRSEEEGFGGIYISKQSFRKVEVEAHENHPAYDKIQGSEVKEKEKATRQTGASN